MDPNGKVAIVTGAAAGIGLSIAKTFLENGVSVALLDRDKENGEEIKQQLQNKYGEKKVDFFVCNVAVKEEFQGAVEEVVKKFTRLDIFVNNAGVSRIPRWEYVIEVNLLGVMRGAEEALKYMSKENGGSGGVVINIASILGLVTCGGSAPYIASKHGVIGFTRSLGTREAHEASGVRHVAVCPGVTDSNLTRKLTTETIRAMAQVVDTDPILQKPENVATGVLNAVRSAPNGSIWIVENDEPAYEISIPNYKDMKVTPD